MVLYVEHLGAHRTAVSRCSHNAPPVAGSRMLLQRVVFPEKALHAWKHAPPFVVAHCCGAVAVAVTEHADVVRCRRQFVSQVLEFDCHTQWLLAFTPHDDAVANREHFVAHTPEMSSVVQRESRPQAVRLVPYLAAQLVTHDCADGL